MFYDEEDPWRKVRDEFLRYKGSTRDEKEVGDECRFGGLIIKTQNLVKVQKISVLYIEFLADLRLIYGIFTEQGIFPF